MQDFLLRIATGARVTTSAARRGRAPFSTDQQIVSAILGSVEIHVKTAMSVFIARRRITASGVRQRIDMPSANAPGATKGVFGAAKNAASATKCTRAERVSKTTPPAALKMVRWCAGTVPIDSEGRGAMCAKLVSQGRIVMHVNRATILRVVLTSVRPSATAKQRVTDMAGATAKANVSAMRGGLPGTVASAAVHAKK